MESVARLLSWGNVVGVVFVYYLTLGFYRLFLHPLARFPGPKLAAVSRWYEGYYDLIKGGQYTHKIKELHKKYGPIIRISPYELHVIDPAFFEVLYRMDGRWDKYAWTYDAFGARNSTIFGSDHDAHKAYRSAIAPLFSKAKIDARQDIVLKNVDKFCERIAGFAGTTVNLEAATGALARDIANEFILGKKYNDLDSDDFNYALSVASLGTGKFWRTNKFIRWYGPALKMMPVDWVSKTADQGMKAFLRLFKAAFKHIRQEVGTVSGAGYETTASALRLIFFHVFTNPPILHRLRQELDSATTTTPLKLEPLPLKTLLPLPYLTAVLTEGLRLSPAVATRAARISDKDLFYGAWRIPARTPVGMTTLLMHTDEKLYPDAMRFDPGRWLGEGAGGGGAKKGGLGRRGLAPFGRGTRGCLGMHLAWAEMYVALAALVQRFDFVIEGATATDFEFERDDFSIGTKAGCNLLARVSLRGN
ncbi:cytochrome P450 [Chaetomium tenue]|uniref:Cytochrome P450 n=1 Tax=Chaetomium tenue TaxID=1854479 RepID=A0ACB7PQQ6_9PEZI|nr:cytochrome P450 [Chaetomium globosum]